MTWLAIILLSGWLQGGSPGFVWWYRQQACTNAPAVVTDAPYAYAACEFGQIVVTVKGRYSYLVVDGELVTDNRVYLPQVWYGR